VRWYSTAIGRRLINASICVEYGRKNMESESDQQWNDKKTVLAAAPSSSGAHHFERTYIDD
jgi:hypothetical protein